MLLKMLEMFIQNYFAHFALSFCHFVCVCVCSLKLALVSADTHFEYYGSFQMSVSHIELFIPFLTYTHSLTQHNNKQKLFKRSYSVSHLSPFTSLLIVSKCGLAAHNNR